MRPAAVTLVVVAGVMFMWGLAWAAGGYEECAGGHFLFADAVWAALGVLLAVSAGIVAAFYLAAVYGGIRALGLGVLLVLAIGLSSMLGGALAERLADCPGATRSSGELFAIFGAMAALIGWLIGSVVHALRPRRDPPAWGPHSRQ